jgi:hypothetical protein
VELAQRQVQTATTQFLVPSQAQAAAVVLTQTTPDWLVVPAVVQAAQPEQLLQAAPVLPIKAETVAELAAEATAAPLLAAAPTQQAKALQARKAETVATVWHHQLTAHQLLELVAVVVAARLLAAVQAVLVAAVVATQH